MSEVYLTPEGFERLRRELEELKGPKRREVIQAVKTAREHGDLSENAEYDAAKEEQGKLERRIHHLETELAQAKMIDKTKIPEGKISLGQTVQLRDLDSGEDSRFCLVAPAEADFDAGKISVTSPLGRGLVGHSVGTEVEIQVPAGRRRYRILASEMT